MDCLFCRIARKELSAETVYENEGAVAILDMRPLALGHTMVLPKTHAETILDLPATDAPKIWEALVGTTRILKKAFSPDGFTIGINHGRASGQAIDHLHIHIIPRWQGDGGTSIHGVVKNAPHESVAETARRIRSAAHGS